jgi:hypothetical protein
MAKTLVNPVPPVSALPSDGLEIVSGFCDTAGPLLPGCGMGPELPTNPELPLRR